MQGLLNLCRKLVSLARLPSPVFGRTATFDKVMQSPEAMSCEATASTRVRFLGPAVTLRVEAAGSSRYLAVHLQHCVQGQDFL